MSSEVVGKLFNGFQVRNIVIADDQNYDMDKKRLCQNSVLHVLYIMDRVGLNQ